MRRRTLVGRCTVAIATQSVGPAFSVAVFEAPIYESKGYGRQPDTADPTAMLLFNGHYQHPKLPGVMKRLLEAQLGTESAPAWHSIAGGQGTFGFAPAEQQTSLFGGAA